MLTLYIVLMSWPARAAEWRVIERGGCAPLLLSTREFGLDARARELAEDEDALKLLDETPTGQALLGAERPQPYLRTLGRSARAAIVLERLSFAVNERRRDQRASEFVVSIRRQHMREGLPTRPAPRPSGPELDFDDLIRQRVDVLARFYLDPHEISLDEVERVHGDVHQTYVNNWDLYTETFSLWREQRSCDAEGYFTRTCRPIDGSMFTVDEKADRWRIFARYDSEAERQELRELIEARVRETQFATGNFKFRPRLHDDGTMIFVLGVRAFSVDGVFVSKLLRGIPL